LESHYNNKYFAADRGQYSVVYTPEEIIHKEVQCDEISFFAPTGGESLLEVGCGEGFVLNYFSEKGWKVEGIDFTLDGIQKFFPHLGPKVRVGNLFGIIDELVQSERKYDLIICNNVLEHVIDPERLLAGIKGLLQPHGVCRIIVPNDDSSLHSEIVRLGFGEPNYWICAPDHLNYFNEKSLVNLLKTSGFTVKELLAEFPIELFLFNPDSNYQWDRSKGKNCHYARVRIENMLANEGIEKWIAFRRGSALAGLGRDLVAYCTV
jgi:2-polyprenyl-3-methyl-5-hydroxy-6-metoxy-1,4-benzoquinol methylase